MAHDEKLAGRLRDLLVSEAGLEEKRIFGGLAFLIHGNMAVAASGEGDLLIRADPEGAPAHARSAHVRPMVMRGRPMNGWLRVDVKGVATKRQLERWVRPAVTYARSLPPKAK